MQLGIFSRVRAVDIDAAAAKPHIVIPRPSHFVVNDLTGTDKRLGLTPGVTIISALYKNASTSGSGCISFDGTAPHIERIALLLNVSTQTDSAANFCSVIVSDLRIAGKPNCRSLVGADAAAC